MLRALLLATAALLVGCLDTEGEALPSCEALGCPLAPSGNPDQWEPCPEDQPVCYCGAPALACAPAYSS